MSERRLPSSRTATPTSEADHSVLEAALREANLAVLVSALAHLTEDLGFLERAGDPRRFDHGRSPATLPEEAAEAIRAEAFAVLSELDPDRPARRAPLDAESLHRIMEFCAGEPIAPDYVPLVEEEADFEGDDPRRFQWRTAPDPAARARFQVGIIGAGLGGLGAAIRLEQAGIPYTIFEKNTDVGGTWFENTFPDLRVDVPNHFYSYSFAPKADWSDHYARRDEIADYIARCAKEHAVLPHVRFGAEVVRAEFDEASGRWRVHLHTAEGEEHIEVNVLISAVGMLSRPSIPDLDGLDTFEGDWFHSARWNHDIDLEGKRVAVVGTGASAMQFVPAIAPCTERLTVFQRSRHWVTPNPKYHLGVSEREQWLFAHVPYYAAWYRFLLFWNSADRMYPAFRVDPAWPEPDVAISAPNDKLRRIMTDHLRRELADRPELVAEVLPDYPALGKRMLQDNGWFRALLRDNVELVNERIARVEPHAVITESGGTYGADVIVLGTGFHPNKYLWPMDIIGRDGTDLHDVWGEDPRAYLGMTVPGFPNLFCIYGPNTNPVVGSVIFVLKCQIGYIVQAVGAMIEEGVTTLECRRDVHDEYNAAVDAEHEQLVWRHPRVHSYYNNRAGRVTTNMPWTLLDYWRMTRHPSLDDFVAHRSRP